ncbi:MAG: DUF5666 domain-containing protein [Chloroflexota bacterium]|nr:DUF5666 domain-containing protein [Chloroflexota bacterium]
MTEPFEPTETTAAAEPTQHVEPGGASFSATLNRPGFLRVGVVLSAGLVLLVSAALALAASPTPTGGSNSGTTPPLPGKADRGFGFGFGGFGPSVFGGPGGGLDLKGARRGGPGFGQISIASIDRTSDGANVGLKTDDGWTRTIAVAGSTRITKGGLTIAIGDLKVGDAIRFAETRNTDGSYTITAIQVVVPQVVGTVTGVTADGFTLTSRKNATWTITVTGTTSYLVGGAAGSKSDLKVGANVAVAGTQTGDSALTALTVRIELPRVIGKVTAKTADTITVQRLGGGTATIHVGSGTTYRIPGDTSPSLADIAVGAVIGAQGHQRADGSLDATVVQAAPRAGRWFGDGPNSPKGPKTSPSPSAATG